MDIKKFEQLIDLVINEDQERANELFHEICVEKSREIFESILAEEDDEDMMEADGDQVGDLSFAWVKVSCCKLAPSGSIRKIS